MTISAAMPSIVACRQDHQANAFTHTLTETDGANLDSCQTKMARKLFHNLQLKLRRREAHVTTCAVQRKCQRMELLAEREMLQALLDRKINIRRHDTDHVPLDPETLTSRQRPDVRSLIIQKTGTNMTLCAHALEQCLLVPKSESLS